MHADNEDETTGAGGAAVATSTSPYRDRATAALADVPREPGARKPDPILVAENVVRRFGGLTAVDVERVEIQRNAITALIGPNGAGKTTLFNLLTGFDQADEGTWTFEGDSVNKLSAHKLARRGMVRTFQLTKALSRLTVIENMRLGAQDQRGERLLPALLPFLWRSQEKEISARATELLARFKLDTKREDFAGSLSGGQRKLLEMARALMSDPTMVMLDEPMAGVNPALTQSLLGHVKDLREQGMTVLFVEHDMDMVRDISDWVIVMAQGKIVSEGPPDAVMADPAVIDAYLGGHHDEPLDEEDAAMSQPGGIHYVHQDRSEDHVAAEGETRASREPAGTGSEGGGATAVSTSEDPPASGAAPTDSRTDGTDDGTTTTEGTRP